MTAIQDLLATQLARGGQPAITWYGDGGERVELSGAVLVNWVNKTTNLLVEEFDVEEGSSVRLNLPPHWRTIVWALATWRAGGTVVLDGQSDEVDVVVTDQPQRWPDAAEVVAVSLPALARVFDGELPPGAIDAAQAVMTYGDQLGYVPSDGAEIELDGATIAVPSSEHRTLWPADDVQTTIRGTVALLAAGASVVLVHPARRPEHVNIAVAEGAVTAG